MDKVNYSGCEHTRVNKVSYGGREYDQLCSKLHKEEDRIKQLQSAQQTLKQTLITSLAESLRRDHIADEVTRNVLSLVSDSFERSLRV